MRRFPLISLHFMFLIFWFCAGLALGSTQPSVEIPNSIHFLTPSGDDVEIPPGTYQVEAVESWLKLIPEGGESTEATLLEGTLGNHEENLTRPSSRLTQDPENSDVYHLAVLLEDGTGVEAVGTISGIYARSTRLSFLQRRTRRSALGGLAGRRLQSGFPRGSTSTVKCDSHTSTASAHDRVASRPG